MLSDKQPARLPLGSGPALSNLALAARISLTLAAALSLMGCGCSYGAPSAVDVSPEMGCLEASAKGGCAHFTLNLINRCEEAVSLISSVNGPVEVAPGQSMSWSPLEVGELTEDEESCQGEVVIPAAMGQLQLELRFTFELVNRGAGGC